MPPMWPHDCDHFHNDIYYGPNLAFEATQELMDHIPEETWAIPEAYSSRYSDNELIWPSEYNTKKHDFESVPRSDQHWRKHVDELITPWVKYLNKVERFLDFADDLDRQIKAGKGLEFTVGDALLHRDYEELRSVTEKTVPKQSTRKHLESTRSAFVSLLSLGARQELGFKRLPKVKPDDEGNARRLVAAFNRKRGGLERGSVYAGPYEG